MFASARLFTNLMVHPNTLFYRIHKKMDFCAITIQASTAVEIVFKWTASSVLPLEPFLQLFFCQRFRTETWDFLTLQFFKYTPSGRALEFQSMVSSGTPKKSEN